MNEEQLLVERILQGDLHAYQHLVKRYERLVVHMIGRLIHQKEDVEDLCQDVFLMIYKKLPSYNFESKLSTWIATIAYRTAINYLKKKRLPIHTPASEAAFEQEMQPTEESPESLLSKKDWQAFIHRQIASLPLQYRTVLTLFHLEEFNYAEIEATTGMPEGTVKSYLFRARKLLKEKLMVVLQKEKVL
ncbi:MAG: sigma-70 family RNA polymerase sigma factor [Bacteroidota bacterium]